MEVRGRNGILRPLLTNALEGAASKGADTELVHLYDLDFKGCISCFACKSIEGTTDGTRICVCSPSVVYCSISKQREGGRLVVSAGRSTSATVEFVVPRSIPNVRNFLLGGRIADVSA